MKTLFLSTLLLLTTQVGFAWLNPYQIGFVKNEGFVTYENGKDADDILYRFSGKEFSVDLRRNGFSYNLNNSTKLSGGNELSKIVDIKGHRVDMVLEGMQGNFQIIESKQGFSNLEKHDPMDASRVHSLKYFSRILYKSVYKGIDLELLVDLNGKFKYNFIVEDGADEKQIVIKIVGARNSTINANGNLEIVTEIGTIEEKIPISYETTINGGIGKKFLAKYVQLGLNQFGLTFSGTHKFKRRVVDPVPYCSYYGGSGYDAVSSIIVDDSGYFYTLGTTSSPNAISTPGSYQPNLSSTTSNMDLFLCKFNKDGVIIWGTYFGGPDQEAGYQLVLDKGGNIVICGFTKSSTGIATSGAFQPNLVGTQDALICKFNTNGNLIWSTYFGFSQNEQFNSIAIDKSGDYYLVGSTNSTKLFTQPGVHQSGNAGNWDGILIKFSPDGFFKWGTYLGGTEEDKIAAVQVDKNKNIYVGGTTFSANGISTLGSYLPNKISMYDPFVIKFDSMGTRVFGTYLGGNKIDYLTGMVLDNQGNLVFIGQTSSDSLIATSNAFQTSFGGEYDGLIGKMDTAGNIIFITYLGSTNYEAFNQVCVDKENKIYVTGMTNSTNNLATNGAYQSNYGGGNYDALFACFSPSGNKLWMSYLGGSLYDASSTIAYSLDHSLIMGGMTMSTSNLATNGSHQNIFGGNYDAFFFKFYLPKDTCANPFKAGFTTNQLIQCERDNRFIFTDTTKSSISATRIWDFGNGIFGSTQTDTIHYLPAVNNKFTVRLTVTDGNCIDSAKKDVFLIKNPSAKKIIGNISARIGITETYDVPNTNGSTFKWVFESGIAVGTTFANSIKIKWTAEDTVTLKVVETTGGGCLGDTAYLQVVIHDPTGTEEHNLKSLITVFPNPTNEWINITYEGFGKLSYELRDMQGRIILNGLNENNSLISLEGNSAGMYFLFLNDENGNTAVQRIELMK